MRSPTASPEHLRFIVAAGERRAGEVTLLRRTFVVVFVAGRPLSRPLFTVDLTMRRMLTIIAVLCVASMAAAQDMDPDLKWSTATVQQIDSGAALGFWVTSYGNTYVKELQLQPAQAEKIKQLKTDYYEKIRANRALALDVKRSEALRAEMHRAQLEVLTAEQAARYKELLLQRPSSWDSLPVVRELELTDEQRQRIAKIKRDTDAAKAKVPQPQGEHFGDTSNIFPRDAKADRARQKANQARIKKLQTLEAAERRQLLAVMTPAQQKRLKELQGNPFRFPDS